MNSYELLNLFNKPKIIGLCANVDEGKSNLVYYAIQELLKEGNKNIVSFGLKINQGEKIIYSLRELEECNNNIIFLDEVMTLFDLDNRMAKRQIENTLRLIVHKNNILVLCGLPENFKKFLCGKINEWIYKSVTIEDFIRGSSVKRIITDYKGNERGNEILSLGKGEAIVYSNKNYNKVSIPYLPKFDTKAGNKPLRVSVNENVNGSVNEKCIDNVSKYGGISYV
jgi:hypothetical protein